MDNIYDIIASKNTTIIKETAEGNNVFKITRTEKADDHTVYVFGLRVTGYDVLPKPEFAFILDNKFNYSIDPNGNVRVKFGDVLEYIVI